MKKNIFTSFIVTCFSLFLLWNYLPVVEEPIVIRYNIKHQKSLELRAFYTQDATQDFVEYRGYRQLVEPNQEEIVFSFKTSSIYKLRLDFGEFPGKISLADVKIIGKNAYPINSQQLDQTARSGIDSTRIVSDNWIIYSNQVFPYIETLPMVNAKKYPDLLYLVLIALLLYGVFFKVVAVLFSLNRSPWFFFFLMALLLIMLFPILQIDGAEQDKKENRNLAKLPVIWKEGHININFGKDYETYLQDHFTARRFVIDTYQKVLAKINGEVQNEKAFEAKENWLFYKAENAIGSYQNLNLFSANDLQKIVENLRAQKKYLDSQGIAFYIFVTPDKNRIYGEYYPDYIEKKNPQGRAELLSMYLEKNATDIRVIYPYKELINAKGESRLYLKTDTHWNEYGALIGYQSLMKIIVQSFPTIKIMEYTDFTFLPTSEPSGDLSDMLGVTWEDVKQRYGQDTYLKPMPIKPYSFVETQSEQNESGNKIMVKTENASKPYKVFVYRDSFATALLPYISNTFGEVNYFWRHDFMHDQDKINLAKPDIVILEMVERYAHILLQN
jgi:alginate O-acetyltransferase complex protein AlgJ